MARDTNRREQETSVPTTGEGWRDLSRRLRSRILRMAVNTRAHIGPALSVVDVLCVLYATRIRARNDEMRDRMLLSKGHGCLALYALLAEYGFIPEDHVDTYGLPGNPLAGHPERATPGVEFSTGSLGHGLSIGAGIALGARMDRLSFRTFVVLGDGELGEGSCWEAAMFASHRRLGALTAIVDRNGMQQEGKTSEILDCEPLAERWRSFGWSVEEVDGHDHEALASLLDVDRPADGRPLVLIARTVKGKGISFMEGDASWHMRHLTREEAERAERELSGSSIEAERAVRGIPGGADARA